MAEVKTGNISQALFHTTVAPSIFHDTLLKFIFTNHIPSSVSLLLSLPEK